MIHYDCSRSISAFLAVDVVVEIAVSILKTTLVKDSASASSSIVVDWRTSSVNLSLLRYASSTYRNRSNCSNPYWNISTKLFVGCSESIKLFISILDLRV